MAATASAAPQQLTENQLTTYAANNAQVKLITYPNGATVPVEGPRFLANEAAFLDALALGHLNAQDPAAARAAIAASQASPLPYFGKTRTIGYASGEGYLNNPVNPAWRAAIAPKLANAF